MSAIWQKFNIVVVNTQNHRYSTCNYLEMTKTRFYHLSRVINQYIPMSCYIILFIKSFWLFNTKKLTHFSIFLINCKKTLATNLLNKITIHFSDLISFKIKCKKPSQWIRYNHYYEYFTFILHKSKLFLISVLFPSWIRHSDWNSLFHIFYRKP